VITVPLLHLLKHCTERECDELQDFLNNRVSSEEVFELDFRLLVHYGSLQYTMAMVYRDLAKEHLRELKDSIY